MLSIGKLIATQASYYTHQLAHSLGEDTPVLTTNGSNQTDYYTAHQAPSLWLGSGLHRLGLELGEPVDAVAFEHLMNHQTPGGEAMILPHAVRLKVAAFDLTLSAPKSVSLLFAFGQEEVRAKVLEAHREAVEEAITYMEQQASQTRLVERHRDQDGTSRMETRTVPTEGFVAAGFDHYTSRAQDPQLHTHVVAINRVWTEGGWRALDSQQAYAHAKAGGTIYEAKLRDALTHRLGVSWGPVTNGISDISGFSPELIRHFSVRKTEIDLAVERHLAKYGGAVNRRMTQAFTLETRQAKVYPKEQSPLVRRMKDYGISTSVESHWYQKAIGAPGDVISLVEQAVSWPQQSDRPTDRQLEHGAPSILESLVRKQAVFTERDLIAQVATLFPGGATAKELTAATKLVLAAGQASGEVLTVIPSRGELSLPADIHLAPHEIEKISANRSGPTPDLSHRPRVLPGEPRFTTRAQLEREAQVLWAVTTTSPVVVDNAALERSIRVRHLVDEQGAALRHLAKLDGRVVMVVGPGGSGKTQAIGAYAEAVRSSERLVIGVATSATAAARLGQSLDACWTGTIALLRHHLESNGQSLPSRTVLLVDEASMVSTYDLAWLVQQTEACDGKLVLIGDPRQLPSVDSGGLFHRLVAQGDGVVDELASVNQRQLLDVDRHNLDRLRNGKISEAIHDYTEAGRVHLGKNESATKSAMVEAWWQDVEGHGLEQVRMLASRHDEVEMLNQLARLEMTNAGGLAGPTLTNRRGTEFQAGERVVVRDNWYSHSDLRNGQTGTVASVDPEHGTVRFRRDVDGRLIDLPKPYVDRDLDWAYAQTIHTAQGRTFGVTHFYADLGVKAEHGYTALSRARGETHLWLSQAPGPLGECTYVHGDLLVENRIAVLVRQLSQSVVEPLAHDQGIAVQSVTDRRLFEERNRLEETIRQSPIASNIDEELKGLDLAIEEARDICNRFGTRGAQAQLRYLEALRADLAEQRVMRHDWMAKNLDVLGRYSAISYELHHRLKARLALYSIAPPEDLVAAIGERPEEDIRRGQWDEIAFLHAQARLELGPTVDLADHGLLSHLVYRDAVRAYGQPELALESPTPVLRRAG